MGKVTTLERDPRALEIAREAFAEAGLESSVRVVEGPAFESLADLARDASARNSR